MSSIIYHHQHRDLEWKLELNTDMTHEAWGCSLALYSETGEAVHCIPGVDLDFCEKLKAEILFEKKITGALLC